MSFSHSLLFAVTVMIIFCFNFNHICLFSCFSKSSQWSRWSKHQILSLIDFMLILYIQSIIMFQRLYLPSTFRLFSSSHSHCLSSSFHQHPSGQLNRFLNCFLPLILFPLKLFFTPQWPVYNTNMIKPFPGENLLLALWQLYKVQSPYMTNKAWSGSGHCLPLLLTLVSKS